MHALQRVFLRSFLFCAAPADIRNAVCEHQRDRIRAALITMSFGGHAVASRQAACPRLRREYCVRITHPAVVRHGADARQRTTDVLLYQAQRSSNARACRTLRFRPRQPNPRVRPLSFAIGPLTITTGNALPEAACNCSAFDSGSRKASTAAINTGRSCGRPPAIASAIAQVSTVVIPPRGGNLPITSVVAAPCHE